MAIIVFFMLGLSLLQLTSHLLWLASFFWKSLTFVGFDLSLWSYSINNNFNVNSAFRLYKEFILSCMPFNSAVGEAEIMISVLYAGKLRRSED